MKISRTSNINAHRDSWVEVNIDNVSNNIRALKNCIPDNMKFFLKENEFNFDKAEIIDESWYTNGPYQYRK